MSVTGETASEDKWLIEIEELDYTAQGTEEGRKKDEGANGAERAGTSEAYQLD